MSSEYVFDIRLKSPKGHEIGIDSCANYGYFTHADGSEGGGLWFDQDTSAPDGTIRMRLYDYDGVVALPAHVYITLLNHPLLIVDEEFNPHHEA